MAARELLLQQKMSQLCEDRGHVSLSLGERPHQQSSCTWKFSLGLCSFDGPVGDAFRGGPAGVPNPAQQPLQVSDLQQVAPELLGELLLLHEALDCIQPGIDGGNALQRAAHPVAQQAAPSYKTLPLRRDLQELGTTTLYAEMR